MQISEAGGGAPALGAEPCRFPKLEECAHFHYERVQLPRLNVSLQTNMDQSLHSQHTNDEDDSEWFAVQVTSGDACWLVQRNFENFKMLDAQLHQCIFDRKISQLMELEDLSPNDEDLESKLMMYLERFSDIADNSVNCGPVLNWLQMDNKGHRLLVPSEESRSINTPAVAAAYSVRRYVSQARDELNLEVGDMISVIDMASPGESVWWRGKRGFQVGFFPQHCVHIIGDKIPRNMPLPPPVVGSLALTPIKPVLRKHGKLITFFRSFILNRPSRRRLKQSGILKERVFGCDLGEHLLNSGNDVPMVLKCCAEFIEKKGIVDGIYRLSGVTSNIQKLRNTFDEDRVPNLYTDDILQDIHSVASLLKMYFRELPNPLCTYQLYQSFVNAVQGCSMSTRNSDTDHERLLKMRETVQKLPPPHYRTLEYLMRHLARVAKHGASTGMTTRNVAIVWAPNLLRCEALEVGGVAALQGVGVQAVVTEFLICYADLIFCDHLDKPTSNDALMKKCRPNSLNISTPTKLITLEEARSKHLPNKSEESAYIEVGGGPKNLPKKYHTVIELPAGMRKRGATKRSPLGWRMFFSRSRNSSQGNLTKNRKASTPITINEKSVTESDLTDMKRKLRSVKSAESLTSGHSEPASSEDVLGPLHCLSKPQGHNRSVSHDSYFDTLQNSQNNSEGSLLDLSEIQLNFELEESEMRIFSEDESLVSSPRINKETQRRILSQRRSEDNSNVNITNCTVPSPKKQLRIVLSPECQSRKRTRLEDQLSDIQYIDCNTPENIVSTTAVVHTVPESPTTTKDLGKLLESYQPKNKSPRNSDNIDKKTNKRQSLNLDYNVKTVIPKSLTEVDINNKLLGVNSILTTPESPGYKQLESSATSSPTSDNSFNQYNNKKVVPIYENVLTTISITYKSPQRSAPNSPNSKSSITNVYENVINPEKVDIPTSTASLPIQEASQPEFDFFNVEIEERPKSLSALEEITSTSTLKQNLSSSAICNTSNSLGSLTEQKTTLSSNQSSGSNIQYTASISSAPYHCIDNGEQLSPTDLSLSEVIESSITTSQTSVSFPSKIDNLSPNVSPTQMYDSYQDLLTPSSDNKNTSEEGLSEDKVEVNLIDFSPVEGSPTRGSNIEKRKSDESEFMDENDIYQQVKYFRRSIHEINALLDMEKDNKPTPEENYDSLEPENSLTSPVYENINEETLKESHVYENVVLKTEREQENVQKSKKVYEKDSLPPCLRARNLKQQMKTRSLDEDAFNKEFSKETLNYKTNSLPKTLNQPKVLPNEDETVQSMHLAHSTENIKNLSLDNDEDLKKRERIEKYKEERRKILQDKYRSESFKEDKEVLLTRFRIFKNKDEKEEKPVADVEKPVHRIRRRSTHADEGNNGEEVELKKDYKFMTESLKSRAAIFEQKSKQTELNAKNSTDFDDVKNLDFIRNKRGENLLNREERRRYTFDTRERETSDDRQQRRISLESKNPKMEKVSPTYCIKDMKAIFESKSK